MRQSVTNRFSQVGSGNVALSQLWPGIPSSSSYLLDAPAQFLPSLSVPRGVPGILHCSSSWFSGKRLELLPWMLRAVLSSCQGQPLLPQGHVLHNLCITYSTKSFTAPFFYILKCCSKWNKAFPIFFPLKEIFFFFPEAALCLLRSSGQVGTHWCVHGQECEEPGEHTQGVGHGTDPTQSIRIL